jgi:hypothetical protein
MGKESVKKHGFCRRVDYNDWSKSYHFNSFYLNFFKPALH